MIYDNMDANGTHSDYNEHIKHLDEVIKAYLNKSKIMAGVPFYGYKGGPSFTNIQSKSYRDIYNTYHPTPDMDLVDGFSYNGPDTISKKTKITLEKGFGGMMIWEVSYDLYPINESSLLYQINKEIPINTNSSNTFSYL